MQRKQKGKKKKFNEKNFKLKFPYRAQWKALPEWRTKALIMLMDAVSVLNKMGVYVDEDEKESGDPTELNLCDAWNKKKRGPLKIKCAHIKDGAWGRFKSEPSNKEDQ